MSVVTFECLSCGHTQAAASPPRCSSCGGPLDPVYAYDAVDPVAFQATTGHSMWQFETLLPVAQSDAVTMGEGATPLLSAPQTADRIGLTNLYIKDEGQTPTGTVHDRAFAATVSAVDPDSDFGLASTGVGGQSAAAYAARGGVNAHVYIPARASFGSQAMVNVHGADMNVVEGRYPETQAAFADGEHDWYSIGPFETPFRHDGLKTVFYEIVADLDWQAPDVVVTPAGHGELPYAVFKAADELHACGIIDTIPRIALVQPETCAPIVQAITDGVAAPEPWDTPDTICGGLEVPDPTGGQLAVAAIADTDGHAVSRPDTDILAAACYGASDDGIELGTGGGAAVAGIETLVDRGAIATDDTVVAINPTAAMQQVDVIRSHLMSPEWDRRAE